MTRQRPRGHWLYPRWFAIVQRCTNPAVAGWKYYGGRGIGICDEWRRDFLAFLADVGEPPDRLRKWSLDRIDGHRDYEPGNVRWVDQRTQAIHRRSADAAVLERWRARVPPTAEGAPRALPGPTLGQLLVQARVARGLTQRQLAESLGLQPQAVQRYEAAAYAGASLTRVEAVAAALQLELVIAGALGPGTAGAEAAAQGVGEATNGARPSAIATRRARAGLAMAR